MLAIHVNHLVPNPPPVITQTPENTHMPYTQTNTHAGTQIFKCPTHNIPETVFTLLSVNKQTPTYSSDTIDADA